MISMISMRVEDTTLEDLQKEFGAKIEPDFSTDSVSAEDASGQSPNPTPRFDQPLFNATPPQIDLKREKYEHRIIAMLKAAGYSNVEIEQETGYNRVTIGYVVKQPWAQALILGRICGTGDKAMKRLQDATEAAAIRLIKIAEGAVNEEVKRKANNDILDRKYGKPNQPYSFQEKPVEAMSDNDLGKILQEN